MGVYIKDMKMPKCCDECSIRAMALSWCNVAKHSTSHSNTGKPLDQSKRPQWCPLVEIKEPHGRLLDETRVLLLLAHAWEANRYPTAQNIYELPAEIEAEGDDKNAGAGV